MLNIGSKKSLFFGYNTAVVLVFAAIIFAVTVVSYFQYNIQVDEQEQVALSDLEKQGEILNAKLNKSVQAIRGMQKFAHYFLQYPDELLTNTPTFLQDGNLFYLDKPRHDIIGLEQQITGNISGFGNVKDFDLARIEELTMAYSLSPAFMSANQTIAEATWFYYISFSQFVNIYPWIAPENWHFSEQTLNNKHVTKIRYSNKSKQTLFWSSPYIDAAGTGLNSSLSLGVFRQNKMIGALVIDINLASLNQGLPTIFADNHGLILLNKENNLLVYKHNELSKLSPDMSWQSILPGTLKSLSREQLLLMSDSTVIDGWLLQKHQLKANGWILLHFQPYSAITTPILHQLALTSAKVLLVLITFLALLYWLTRRTFIKPAIEFIDHIEHCAKGDPGKVKPSIDWQPWFKIVENIFSQNRSLLQQLKDQNNILDRRVSEKTQALMESNQQHQWDYALLSSVMNAMPELIIFNDENGKLIGCNRAFEEFINQNKNDILDLEISHLMPPILGKALNELSSISLQSFDRHAFHQRVVETDSQSYEVFSTQFFNDNGLSLGTINIFRDVTVQHSTESALKRAKTQAELANKAKSQFLANMSHEIRTPINAMQGMMELLGQTTLNPDQYHYLTNAQQASGSLLHLIDELLDLSKIEAGKMFISKEKSYLDLIVDKALKLNVGMAFQKNINLVVDIDANVPQHIMTDSTRLMQVLTNLINNAVKFTHQGEIRLSIILTAQSEHSVLLRFKVTDTGIGIAKNKQKHLFDAFNQADGSMTREYGGSGLGLSISQQIVNLLGGEITLSSEIGQGSDFSFVLPFSIPKGNEVIEELSLLAHEQVLICSLAYRLTAELIDSINNLGWQYEVISSIAVIHQMNAKYRNNKIVLLTQSKYLAELNSHSLDFIVNDLTKVIDLLAICQPTMECVPDNISDKLSTLTLPYILLDLPLYRYSIGEVAKGLLLNKNINLTDNEVNNIICTPKAVNLANINVLLVEDNLVNQLVAKELLKSLKADVIIAENGQQAVDILMLKSSDKTQQIDVVLMDIQMPVMDGLTASKIIRSNAEFDSMPIIAMTAHARAEDKQNSLAAGMNLHIAKPVSVELLSSSILDVLQKEASALN